MLKRLIKKKKAGLVSEIVETAFMVEEGTLVRDAVRQILKKGMKYVPVIDAQHHLIGIVTRASLVDIVYDSIWGEVEMTAETTA